MADQGFCTVRQRRDRLLVLKNDYLEALSSIERDLEILESALSLAEQPCEYVAPPLWTAVDQSVSDSRAPALSAVTSMSMRPRTQLDVLTEMARMHPERTVHLTTAAKQIIADGLSRATRPAHVSATLHTQLTNDPRWMQVDRGTFQLLRETTEDEEVAAGPPFNDRYRGRRASV